MKQPIMHLFHADRQGDAPLPPRRDRTPREGAGMIPELPDPDCRTDWDRDGEGDPAYTPELVKQIQEAAYKAGQDSMKGTA